MSPSWSPGYDSVLPTRLCIYIFSYVGAHLLGLDVAFMKSWLRQCIITSLCIYIFSYVGAHLLGLDVAIMKSWLRQCLTNESVYIYFQLRWSPPAWFRCHFHEVLVTTVYHQHWSPSAWLRYHLHEVLVMTVYYQRVCVYIFSVMLGAHQLGLDVTFIKSWLWQCITNESVYIYFQLCWSPSAWFRCHLHKILVMTVYHQWVWVYIFSVMLEPTSLV